MVKLNLLERFLNRIHAKTEELAAISGFAMDLPTTSPSQSCKTSEDKQSQQQQQQSQHQQQQTDLAPLITGIDDTLNNDFFYDDEFTVPFDANLMDDCQSLPAEVDSLLRRLLPSSNIDNQEWRRSKLAQSKSDSCLYQADQELSDSEREMSTSEHEGSSSSNNSPLQNQSLFSYCGEPLGKEASGSNNDINDSAMSGSLGQDTNRYNYDWTLNKQQYVLLFDRSPTKTLSSEDESCHQVAPADAGRTPPKITSWSRAKSARQKRRTEEMGCRTNGKEALTTTSATGKKKKVPTATLR